MKTAIAAIICVVFSCIVANAAPLPKIVDWRAKGGVSPIGNQGDCGGGTVAFADAANIEGVNFVTNGHLVPVSPQQLLDCGVLDGCNGGYVSATISAVIKITDGYIATNASYPWTSGNGYQTACRNNTGWIRGARVTRTLSLPANETLIAQYVAQTGPVAVVVDPSMLSQYTGGIITNCKFQYYEHVMAIVGYNDINDPPYWLCKNSWGTAWGEEGYVRIAKGSNQCGIAGYARTVEVAKL